MTYLNLRSILAVNILAWIALCSSSKILYPWQSYNSSKNVLSTYHVPGTVLSARCIIQFSQQPYEVVTLLLFPFYRTKWSLREVKSFTQDCMLIKWQRIRIDLCCFWLWASSLLSLSFSFFLCVCCFFSILLNFPLWDFWVWRLVSQIYLQPFQLFFAFLLEHYQILK